MTKTFVLRSNALLSSPHSTKQFGDDNIVVIPMAVLDEINKRKNLTTEKQRIRKQIMDYICSFDFQELCSEKGVIQGNGSTLKVIKDLPNESVLKDEELTVYQQKTLQICVALKGVGHHVILVTNNPCLQMRAKKLGVMAESFRDETFPRLEEQYTGRMTVDVTEEILNEFYSQGYVKIENLIDNNLDEESFIQNQFILLQNTVVADDEKPKINKGYGKVKGDIIERLQFHEYEPFGVKPMNDGQRFLFNALYSDEPLVIVKGSAGTGKTFSSLAVALELLESKEYERILVTRKTDYSSMGYLPGNVDDKMSPYLAGFKDNLSTLLNSKGKRKKHKCESNKGHAHSSYGQNEKEDLYEDGSYYFSTKMIQIQSIDMLRGRSICDTIFIIDEAQNIEPEFIKTIVTRAGKGSKFIFLGDPTQIDNPALNERYNGLVYLSEKMKGSVYSVQITLEDKESVRSDLAREAARIL